MEPAEEFCSGRIFFDQRPERHPRIVISDVDQFPDAVLCASLQSEPELGTECYFVPEDYEDAISHTSHLVCQFAFLTTLDLLAAGRRNGVLKLSSIMQKVHVHQVITSMLKSPHLKRKYRTLLLAQHGKV